MSLPCRKLLKTEGFEGVREASDVRFPPRAQNKISKMGIFIFINYLLIFRQDLNNKKGVL